MSTEDNLHYNAGGDLFVNARKNRKKPTKAEDLLWKHLRNRQYSNMKFRRQHPIKEFIADFYCHELKLVIEVDGNYHYEHNQRDYDEGRSHELEQLGIKVIRFTNKEILEDINMVLHKIKEQTD